MYVGSFMYVPNTALDICNGDFYKFISEES